MVVPARVNDGLSKCSDQSKLLHSVNRRLDKLIEAQQTTNQLLAHLLAPVQVRRMKATYGVDLVEVHAGCTLCACPDRMPARMRRPSHPSLRRSYHASPAA